MRLRIHGCSGTRIGDLHVSFLIVEHEGCDNVEKSYQRLILIVADTINERVHESDHGTEVALARNLAQFDGDVSLKFELRPDPYVGDIHGVGSHSFDPIVQLASDIGAGGKSQLIRFAAGASAVSRFTSTWTKRTSREKRLRCSGRLVEPLLVGKFTMRTGRSDSPRTLVSNLIWFSTVPCRRRHVAQRRV